MTPHIYDVDGAMRLLPVVRAQVACIVEQMGRLPELKEQLRTATYRSRRLEAGNKDAEAEREASASVRAAEDALAAALRELEDLGVRLKDPHVGLVDFLSRREDEVVELCWKLGEDRIAYWHRIGEGYPGRKPL